MSDLDRIKTVMRDLGSVIVAFSGGVDSALVSRVAHDVLGQQAVALTAFSATLPQEEAEIAQAFCESIGMRFLSVESKELDIEEYRENKGNRCFFCKRELFQLAEELRQELGFEWVVDGTILNDLGDHRPGLIAAEQASIRHPLVEARLDKTAVRRIARELGLPMWDKPAFACLGSRFPDGTRITRSKVDRVGHLERSLRNMGFRQFRVRWHEMGSDVLARIQLGADELPRATSDQTRKRIIEGALEAGFRWVTMDLEGYEEQKARVQQTVQARPGASPPEKYLEKS